MMLKPGKHSSRRSVAAAGFSIVELLLALAMMSLLLAAVAVAFNASVVNYRANEDIYQTINRARQALSRITTQLRTATAVEPNSPSNTCSLITSDGQNITYYFNSSDNKLYLITNDISSDPDYVLCDNVTAMTFTKETATEDSLIYVKSVQISMTVNVGGVQRTLPAAAVIRRNLH